MRILKEFREFAVKGNAIDMAVGIVVGASFTKIVNSLVADVIMPPLGVLVGGVDFNDLAVTLKPAVADTPAVMLRYGAFVNNVLDFIIIAFGVFMFVKIINRFRRKEEGK